MTPAQRTKLWRKNNVAKVKAYEKKRYALTHKRVKARRLVAKRIGASALKGKVVEHKVPLKKGGSNSRSNLRVVSRKSKAAYHQKKDGAYRR